MLAIVFFPESPNFLYSKQRFAEARESLAYIARLNGNDFSTKFIFETEIESQESIDRRKQENGDAEPEAENLIDVQENVTGSNDVDNLVLVAQMSEGELFVNLIKMTIMWTQASFN